MKILLTGAAGFTGRFFMTSEEAAGHQVYALQADLTEALGYAFDGHDDDTVRKLAEDLRASYERHIACEEEELFPAAEKLLDGEARAAMLEEMDRRRGR